MGVYIKGMTMPENCDDCLLGADCPHDQSMDGYKMQGGRPRTCPLVEIPPHGDLIDREALMDDIIGSMVFSGRNVPKEAAIVQKVLDIVGDANAILEAEEDE